MWIWLGFRVRAPDLPPSCISGFESDGTHTFKPCGACIISFVQAQCQLTPNPSDCVEASS